MFRAQCKNRAGLLAYRIPRIATVGILPISHSLAALAIHVRKGGVSITYCCPYSVQERLYVLEYRSPTEGGKGGRGGQFLRKGDNIC